MTSITMPTSVSQRTRGVCFTQNNWTPESYAALQAYAKDQCLYMILGKEKCPTTGTPHLQGFLYYENPRVYPNTKLRAISNGAHDELMRGSPRQASEYCKKEGDFWEFGECPAQGARADWDAALAQLQDTKSVINVIDSQPHLIPCIRALERYKQISQKGIHRDVKVIVLIGPPGCGKTRHAWDKYPDLYSKPDGNWFDGYDGQDTLLLDDYYGHLPYAQLLKMCDRYPLLLPVKGGFIPATYTTIIITSNTRPMFWYPGSVDAFNRRITEYRDYSITPDAPQEVVQEAHLPEAPRRRKVKAYLPQEDDCPC